MTKPESPETAVLVGVARKLRPSQAAAEASQATPEESLEELAALAHTVGAAIAGNLIQIRESFDAATLIGEGKVQELTAMVKGLDASVVIFDRELTPTQLRNLEKALEVKVLDRTQLILDIFASRARTREGQLQVELAQLNYLLPRLSGHGVMMSRLGGGIGTRGPGETKLETDRRRIHIRIQKLERDLEHVKMGRATQRRQRVEVPLATIALVGYTNAGKSTLFNRLTGSTVAADARLFATLDPTVRQMPLPSRRAVLLSDTVGFIRHLPTTLVKAFRATLEEVRQAALLIHVVDASSPLAEDHARQVMEVLREIEAAETSQILVLNKSDLTGESSPDAAISRLLGEEANASRTRAVAVSARTGSGIPRLLQVIDEVLPADPMLETHFRIPAGDGATIHEIHSNAAVERVDYHDEACEIVASAPESLRRRLRDFVVQ
ncbi:MAG: GTPase HflX [Candidatus Solibacter usitatus]|nr:GTPase HflX [Candidatus Solibacter usitatus]